MVIRFWYLAIVHSVISKHVSDKQQSVKKVDIRTGVDCGLRDSRPRSRVNLFQSFVPADPGIFSMVQLVPIWMVFLYSGCLPRFLRVQMVPLGRLGLGPRMALWTVFRSCNGDAETKIRS